MTVKPLSSQLSLSSKLTSLTVTLLTVTLSLAGCEKVSDNPKLRTFHPTSAEWQREIEASYDQLTDEERQLLDRYIERINTNEAVKKGASETITIADAILHQQEFEETHQHGQSMPATGSKAYPLTVTLLPTPYHENTNFKNTPLDIQFKNEGTQTLSSFKGIVHLNAPNLDEPQAVVIPLNRFDPPLDNQDTTVIRVDTSVTNEQVIKALQHPQNISITINKGTLKTIGGEAIEFEPMEAQ